MVFGRCFIFWELVGSVRREWLVDANDYWVTCNRLDEKYTGRFDFLRKWGFVDLDEVTREDFDRLNGGLLF